MLKKRLIFTLLYILILNTVIVFADESNIITCSFDGGNITFDTSTGTIIKADETIKISAIPSEIDGFPVKCIGGGAFSECNNITDLYLAKTVESIGNYAFEKCANLSNVVLSNNIKEIGEEAFRDDVKLKYINLPDNLEHIAYNAFIGTSIKFNNNPNCKNFKSINGILYSKDGSTISCVPKDITDEFIIPDNVNHIYYAAFAYCENLKYVKLPSSINAIDMGAFFGCKSLTNVNIPVGVNTIKRQTFKECINLKKIALPSTIKVIEGGAFIRSGLETIDLPYYLESIENSAFGECNALNEVIISKNVKIIKKYAFRDCNNLKKAIFKGDVNTLEIGIFDSCPNLTIYGYRNTNIQKYASENNIPFVEIADTNNESTTIRGFVLNADNPLTINDGAMFYDILKNNKLGNINESDIHTLIQPDKRSFDMVIDLISNASDDNDITYFYYSGHGGIDENSIPFICPDYYHIDKEHDHDMTYYYTYPDLINKLDSIKGKVVIILDCCFSGYINESVYNLNKDKFKILTACKGKEYSSIEDILSSPFYNVTHGIFSSPLIEGLGGYDGKIKADTNKDSKVTLSELYKYIDKNMNKNWKVKDEKTNKVYSYTQNPTVSDPNDDTVIYLY